MPPPVDRISTQPEENDSMWLLACAAVVAGIAVVTGIVVALTHLAEWAWRNPPWG